MKDTEIDCDFYGKIWKMLKNREYDEIVPLAGTSII